MPKHVVDLYVVNSLSLFLSLSIYIYIFVYVYIYITSNKVVLHQYIHFILVYFEHNGDDEPLDHAKLVFKALTVSYRAVHLDNNCYYDRET